MIDILVGVFFFTFKFVCVIFHLRFNIFFGDDLSMSKYEFCSWPSKNKDYSLPFVVRDSSVYNNEACLINLTYHSVFVLYHLMSRQEFLTLRLFIEAYSNSQRGRQVGEQLTFLTIHSMHYTLTLDADQPTDMKSEQVGLGFVWRVYNKLNLTILYRYVNK